MPNWLYFTAIILVIVMAFLSIVLGVWLGVRLFKGNLSVRNLVCVGITLLVLRLGVLVGKVLGGSMPIEILGSVMSVLLIVLVVTRWAGFRGWRAVAASIVAWGLCTALPLAVLFGLRWTIMDSYMMPTSGMAPTLVVGDRFAVDHLVTPRRWDLVTFRAPDGSLRVSRLVGLPGETVEIRQGRVTVNGTAIAAPSEIETLEYSSRQRRVDASRGLICFGGEGSPLALATGEFYVLSDNTSESIDSRYMAVYPGHQPGAIPGLDGVVRFCYAPWDRIRVLWK